MRNNTENEDFWTLRHSLTAVNSCMTPTFLAVTKIKPYFALRFTRESERRAERYFRSTEDGKNSVR